MKDKKRIANYWLREFQKEKELKLEKDKLFTKYRIVTGNLNLRNENGRLNRKKIEEAKSKALKEEEIKQLKKNIKIS